MLSPLDEMIIGRAAAADRDFWLLVRQLWDDAGRRHAVLERRIAIDAKLRGDRPPAPAPLWVPLEQAVDVELERRRDQVRAELSLHRQWSRIGHGCGLVQIRLSYRASARRKLHAIARAAPLSLLELADAFGVEVQTLKNHLTGRRIARARSAWYHRLERVELVDDCVHIVLRYLPTRKRWGWKFNAEQRRLVLSGATPPAPAVRIVRII